MDLILKAALGAAVVVILAALSKTKNYYIAGLVPLFPTFALIAHYIVGNSRSIDDLKATIVFGMWSIIPYFIYLATLYVMVDRMRLEASLAVAVVAWLIAASVLVSVWVRLHS
ncbi:GlpM family protein [Pseudomonas sp. GM30]|nr:GlpM family protein [Pseudomonas sp. GM30]